MESRPQTNEYASYFGRYIELVPEGSICNILKSQLSETIAMLQPVNEEQAKFRYAEDKWSIKEVLGHITDNERIWAYRLLRIVRGDVLAYPSYEEEQFVREAQFDRISFCDLLDEFTFVRRSTILLLKGLTDELWLRHGELYNSRLTARAAACVIAGHETHHRSVLKERYLSQIII